VRCGKPLRVGSVVNFVALAWHTSPVVVMRLETSAFVSTALKEFASLR
jgi:hypothetical protein